MGTVDSAIKLKSKVAHAATAREFNNNVPYLRVHNEVETKFLDKEVKKLKRIVKLVLGNSLDIIWSNENDDGD
ncbi:hypothetical protein CUMW_256370 [Citrus unshiu]|nr:hypothetical protein CUMW_256370 [Citrus unshiu]